MVHKAGKKIRTAENDELIPKVSTIRRRGKTLDTSEKPKMQIQ
jgi:hypothetical protein